MRGRQLSELLAHSARLERRVTFEPVSRTVRNSELFLTKGAARTMDPDMIHSLRHRGNRVFLDPVDEDVSDDVAAAADVLIAASISAHRDLESRPLTTKVVRIDHHVDPRLRRILASRGAPPEAAGPMLVRYFGETVNAVSTPQIAAEVDFVHVDTARQDVAWMQRVPGVHMHYAVRQHRSLDRHKPFLKGFTAALAGANILLARDETEAAFWLPDDYPYWIEAHPSEDAILAGLDYARETFRGEQWDEALAMMRELSARTADSVIVSQLEDALS